MIWLDVETCGLHSVAVLIQYAVDDGPVILHEIWTRPAIETMDLIYWFCTQEIGGFNLAFDWFHICKIYTMLSLMDDTSMCPEDCIQELAIKEERARFVNLCLKPKSVIDLLMWARKSPYQSLMARDPIRIKRVPARLAWYLASELEKRIHFDGIYFASQKDGLQRWKVYDIKDAEGNVNPDFKDVVLRFRPSMGLKALAKHVLKIQNVKTFKQIELSDAFNPEELGYAPFALAVAPDGVNGNWGKSWPTMIREHILHWQYNQDARDYAAKDVDYTRQLLPHFPNAVVGDNDSVLCCEVAAARWRGYAIDRKKLLEQKRIAESKLKDVPRDGKKVRIYLLEVMDPIERMGMGSGTKKTVLEEIIKKWHKDDGSPHPAAIRAKEVLDARKAKKKIEVIDKLLLAGRFHASFVVIGTLSSRMSGTGGLNPQGMDHSTEFRECFPLADLIDKLCGGDFAGFEISLAAKVFDDEGLNKDLISGVKIHAVLGAQLFPGETYESVRASSGKDPDMYDTGKKGVFLSFYGGDEHTFYSKLGIDLEIGTAARIYMEQRYRGIGRFQLQVQRDFGALQQSGGLGTAIEWHDPKEYAESFLGFRRYFTLEHRVCKSLFDLAQNPPDAWRALKIKVIRRDRVQTAGGALQSALYGASFKINSSVVRAAKNHYIQSPGGEITKALQRAIWDLQPVGIGPWLVQPANIHDEVMSPTHPDMVEKEEEVVNQTVNEYKKIVPLLAIEWFKGIKNWAAKKG